MDVDGYLVELFGRLPGLVNAAVEDLDEVKLADAPTADANTIAWLVWHLTRIEDHHLSEAAGTPQRYIEDGWHERFGRGADPQDHGYGHSPADVASVRATADDLAGYHDAVHARTIEFLTGLTPADLDRIVDESWDPPVTLGVRLASVASDCLQHVGQAAYLRGLIT